MAEAKRFELLDPFEPSVFKTDAIDHSAKLPKNLFTITKCYRANLDVGCFPVKADAVILGSVPGRLDPNSHSVL